MQHSEQINELATALAKAQGAIKHAAKESRNPHFGSNYADLASVWEACRQPLADNGLSVVQLPEESEQGVRMTTVLMHTSGQFISGTVLMPVDRATPQAVGSAITYARRYALAAMVGVCPDDDDAEGAMRRGEQGQPQQRQTARKQPTKQPQAPQPPAKPKPFDPDEAREKCLLALGERGISPADAAVIHKAWFDQYEVETGNAPDRAAYGTLYQNIKAGVYDAPAADKEAA